ncbi:GlxA family transcriptional regulator [Saccharopolyspora flava]|nr:helix-turn-helix domain-containing protein [Saccharopolyspora flava]
MHRIAVLGVRTVVGFDLAIPPQVFAGTSGPQGELYDVTVCSIDGGPLPTTRGFSVLPECGVDAVGVPDTVIVPGVDTDDFTEDPEVTDYLRGLPEGTRIMSICTGAFVLAAAGLLDGRPVTTHWAHAERFREMFPQVELHPDLLFVDDGDVLTSAGVAAGIDLCLHVIRSDHGSEIANRAARRNVVPPWRDGGQSQFIERPLPSPGGLGTAPTREWMLHRLAEPLTLEGIAAHAGMSVRTFTRRFREEAGTSPLDWLLGQRIEHARHLLERTDLPIEEVAVRSGLSTATSLRKHLRAKLGIGPAAYRRTFHQN